MKMRANLYQRQFRAVEETLESWKRDHREAMEVRDLEYMINACLYLQECLGELIAEAWQAGFSGKMRASQVLGQFLIAALDASVQTWEVIANWLQDCRARGYEVDNEAAVPQALEAARKLHQDFAQRWPLFRPEDLERGRDQIARGECIATEEEFRRALQDKARQAS
jgi:hypothetical protein